MANFSSLITTSYSNIGISSSTRVYATPSELPLTGLSAGDIAYVISTERFYVSNGNGWNSMSLNIAGQQAYTTAGTYSWTAPSGVTSVSVVAVGGGSGGGSGSSQGGNDAGGGGGGLGWKNNIPVTPGQIYTVVVGAGGPYNTAGFDSWFINATTVKGGGASMPIGGTFIGDGGGNGGWGGEGQPTIGRGGGGAGGYTGQGGNGGTGSIPANNADPGSGGGGGGFGGTGTGSGAAGGGVGIYGLGSSGAGGVNGSVYGKGGSGGTDGSAAGGGLYGGGQSYGNSGPGGNGAVRIIWGPGRSFPSTLTSDQ